MPSCYAFCTATSYNLKNLFDTFHAEYSTSLYDDVVHIEYPKDPDTIGDLFFFSYGAVVMWNISNEDALDILKEIRPFEVDPLDEKEFDEFRYSYGEKFSFKHDKITLPDKAPLSKLAFSHGIAQSARLGAFEITISKSFENNRHLPEYLAKHGKIPLSRKETRKKIGQLFIDRSWINLHLDVLDTPEFFWEYPEYEPIYIRSSAELDLNARTSTLNQQLNVIHDLFDMLGTELNHQHSSRLEWAIIILIVIEVILLASHDILNVI